MLNKKLEPIRIILMNGYILERASIRAIIEKQPDLLIVGDIGNPDQIFSNIASTEADLVLYLYEPVIEGSFEIIKEICNICKHSRIILLTHSNDKQIFVQALKDGVSGIISFDQEPEIFIKAIRKVYTGEIWVDNSIIED